MLKKDKKKEKKGFLNSLKQGMFMLVCEEWTDEIFKTLVDMHGEYEVIEMLGGIDRLLELFPNEIELRPISQKYLDIETEQKIESYKMEYFA
jgi:hypothetical protein